MLDGTRIRQQRLRLALSQARLGKAIAKDGDYVSKIERGCLTNCTAETLEQFARVLGCSMDYFVGLTDDPTPPPRHPAAAVG
jgi:transcriptional regulator with XRE-family HTH domain